MTFVVPGFTYRPVAAKGSGNRKPTLGLVLHVQQGPNSPFGEFDNTANEASSTWWASKSGHGEQYIDPDAEHAWAQAAGNHDYHSVETEGWATEPLTEAQIDLVAAIYAEGHKRWGWPFVLAEKPGDPGLGWHGMGGAAWGGHDHCPGDLRKPQRAAILAKAEALVGGQSAPAPKPVAKPAAPTVNHNTGLSSEKPWGAFPLTSGYFGVNDGTANSHSGLNVADQRAIKQIQREVGVTADGKFGNATKAAVSAWQHAHALLGDGEVGPLTWSKMDNA